MIIPPKIKWLSLLFLATSLFFIGMYTQQLIFFLGTVLLTLYVRKYGYRSLFKDYDDQQKAKRYQAEIIMKKIQQNRQEDRKKNKGTH